MRQPFGNRGNSPRRWSNAAFTLIEVLTSIAILTILVAISIIGMKTLNANARDHQTRAAIGILRAALGEFEANTSAAGGLTLLNTVGAYPNVNTSPLNAPDGFFGPGGSARAFNLANMSGCQAIKNTELIMRKIKTNPNAKAMLDRVPVKNFYVDDSGATTDILADGYGNAIIFVPGGGLWGVNRNGLTGSAADAATGPIRGPDATPLNGGWTGNPFWASAGEDGFFTRSGSTINTEGDDNYYSFTPWQGS